MVASRKPMSSSPTVRRAAVLGTSLVCGVGWFSLTACTSPGEDSATSSRGVVSATTAAARESSEAPNSQHADVAQELSVGSDVSEVEKLLVDQVAAWNDGDIEAFMEGYRRGGELRFVSGAEVREGWAVTLERYRQTYPDRVAMGTLTFDEIEIRRLSSRHALAMGAWRLLREADEPNGRFTLLFERFDGESRWSGWRIVYDHTSSAESPE